MAINISLEAVVIARTIRELPPEDRWRLLRLVELMLAARDDARRHAQTMIREISSSNLEARDDCVESVDATISYLERHAENSRLI
jgi:hypothetical protein